MSNLNTVICRVYVHHRKKTHGWRTKEIWIPIQSRWFTIAHDSSPSPLRTVCVHSHMQKEKKTLAHFVPTHSPRTPPQLCTLSSTAVGGGRRSCSKRHRISPPPLSAAYLHRHSRLWSTGVFCGIGPGIFLMEKVINLAKYSLISYRSPSVAVNQPAEIAVESFLF